MKKIVLIMLAAVMCLLCACAKPAPEAPIELTPPPATPEPTLEPTPTPTPEPTPTPYNGPVNAYTGEPVTAEIAAARPYMFMINDRKEAQPQCGVGSADIIYELLVESGVPRMMVLFKDITGVGPIGTIRSARPYYLDLLRGHDAILVHCGASDEGKAYIREERITCIDGIKGHWAEYFYRDAERRASAGTEHSLFTTSDLIQQLLPEETDFRTTYDGFKEPVYAFAPDAVPQNGQPASRISVKLSAYKPNGVFTYDEATGKYLVEQFDAPYVDGNTGEQVAVSNVIVLYTRVYKPSNSTSGHIMVETVGEGGGLLACGGSYIEINWSRADEDLPFTYTTKDGQPVVLRTGSSYVSIVPRDNIATVEP